MALDKYKLSSLKDKHQALSKVVEEKAETKEVKKDEKKEVKKKK